MHGSGPTREAQQRLAGLLAALALFAGCQQEMAVQPSYKPLQAAELFDDGRSARPLVAGTVARGHLHLDSALYEGTRHRTSATAADAATKQTYAARPDSERPSSDPGQRDPEPGMPPASRQPEGDREQRARFSADDPQSDFVDEFPLPVTKQVLEHGYERYMIYCVVCHDPLGTGRGKIVERGYTRPPSFHIQRLRRAPVGYLFAVVSRGYGSMPSYAVQISARDRWAIVGYLRALQSSQHFPESELTSPMRAEWTEQQAETSAEQPHD